MEIDASAWSGRTRPAGMRDAVVAMGEQMAGGEMVMEMEYLDYGIDVDAEVPPADQTMDWYEFMGRTAAG